jgi:citronellol/citronellal dehydrogenase
MNGRSGGGGNMSYRSVFKPGLFDGQTVIVTGGGSGIGRCTAHEIAALGAHVVITGRKPEKLATVKGEIEPPAAPARPMLSTSARKRRSRTRSQDRGEERPHPRPVQQCGGQFPPHCRGDMSAKGFDVVVRNNLTGGFIVSREVLHAVDASSTAARSSTWPPTIATASPPWRTPAPRAPAWSTSR